MQIEVNGEVKNIPSDLSQVTLGQFIKWSDEYGKALDAGLGHILEADYEDEMYREFDIESHIDKEALSWCSFFTGCDFFEIQKSKEASELIDNYRIIRMLLKQSEINAVDFPVFIEWNAEKWVIQDFRVDPKSPMDFNEIVTSKEAMRQLMMVGKGKWDSLLYLCAMFLRKEGEPFKDEFIHEGSDRLQLMESLPMTYALNVAFFLNSCVSTWASTSASSVLAVVERNLN